MNTKVIFYKLSNDLDTDKYKIWHEGRMSYIVLRLNYKPIFHFHLLFDERYKIDNL